MKLNQQKVKIGIAVPCRDQLHSIFAFNLANMLQFNTINKIATKLYMLSGSLIADQRHKLAQTCIEDKCTHILWLDSDMTFPVDLTERLLKHNLPVIACNYSTRSQPRKSVAYKSVGDWNSWIHSKNAEQPLSEAAAVGMGCMMTEIGVYTNMSEPYFEITYHPELKEWIGEDFYFCKKLTDQGYKILIDNNLSLEISHLGTTAFTLQSIE